MTAGAPWRLRPHHFVWILFVAVIGVIALLQFDGNPQDDKARHGHDGRDDTDIAGRFRVFAFTEPQLGSVEVLYRGRRTEFVRDAAGEWHESGNGQGQGADHGHSHGADGGHIQDGVPQTAVDQFALTARMLADRSITATQPLEAYGLVQPQATFVFHGRQPDGDIDRTGPLAVLHVGDLLTTQYAYYGMLQGEKRVLLLPRHQVSLLLGFVFGSEHAPPPLPARDKDA